MPIGPASQGCAIHPVLLGVMSLIGALLWIFIFKAAAFACEMADAFIQKVTS